MDGDSHCPARLYRGPHAYLRKGRCRIRRQSGQRDLLQSAGWRAAASPNLCTNQAGVVFANGTGFGTLKHPRWLDDRLRHRVRLGKNWSAKAEYNYIRRPASALATDGTTILNNAPTSARSRSASTTASAARPRWSPSTKAGDAGRKPTNLAVRAVAYGGRPISFTCRKTGWSSRQGQPSCIDEPGAIRRRPSSSTHGHPKRYDRIAFVASAGAEAQAALAQLVELYGNHDADDADVVVALGGDGLMLQTLHRHMRSGKPIYGMHRGTVGFLMNEFSAHELHARLAAARESLINPLLMRATDVHGAVHLHHAINEVALFRQTHQAARLRILIDEHERMAGIDRRRHPGGDAGRIHRL